MRFRHPLFVRRARLRGVDALARFVLKALTTTFDVNFVRFDVYITFFTGIPVEEFLLARDTFAVFFNHVHGGVVERAFQSAPAFARREPKFCMVDRARRGVKEELLVSKLSSLKRVIITLRGCGVIIIMVIAVLDILCVGVKNGIVRAKRTQSSRLTILTFTSILDELLVALTFESHSATLFSHAQ